MALRACHRCFVGATESLPGDVSPEVTLESRAIPAIGLDAAADPGHGRENGRRGRGTLVSLVEAA